MRLKSTILLVLLAALVTAPPVSAHDLLVDIDPAPESTINQGTFEAKLTFDNPLLVVEGETNAELSTKLMGSDNWINHDVLILDRVLTAKVILTEPGDYDLRWKVVSSDGHPIDGESTFTLEIEAPAESSDSTEPILIAPNPISPNPIAETTNDDSLTGLYIGMAMVALGAIFAPVGLMLRRRAKKS